MPPFHSSSCGPYSVKVVCPREKKKGLLSVIPREKGAEEWNLLAMVQSGPSPEYIHVHRDKGRQCSGKNSGVHFALRLSSSLPALSVLLRPH